MPDFPTPGVLFRDIAPLLRAPSVFAEVTAWFAERAGSQVNAAAGSIGRDAPNE